MVQVASHSPAPNPHAPAARRERRERRRLAEFIELRAVFASWQITHLSGMARSD
jgi:hypothetical protein